MLDEVMPHLTAQPLDALCRKRHVCIDNTSQACSPSVPHGQEL